MHLVVVGGHSRNIGKTSVMARLIRSLPQAAWTAVKITQYGHGVCSRNGEPCGCAPGHHAFLLTEERDPHGRGDTCRFLAAGARRSLWLRVRQGQLGDALPVLWQALASARWVMIESNSIVRFARPELYLLVLDSAEPDFKDSARRVLDQADAFVTIGTTSGLGAWPGLNGRASDPRPAFRVSRPNYDNPQLARFVRERLHLD